MKKLKLAVACLACAFSMTSFADIKASAVPSQPLNGKDYIGVIMAAQYQILDDKNLLIMTKEDAKLNESGVAGLTLLFDGNDLPFGFTLANAVGKKIAVFFDAHSRIEFMDIITDEYWNGVPGLRRK